MVCGDLSAAGAHASGLLVSSCNFDFVFATIVQQHGGENAGEGQGVEWLEAGEAGDQEGG